MTWLIKKTVSDMHGPEMQICKTVGKNGMKTVAVSFDATKFPFQIKAGFPEKHVCFAGKSAMSVQEADLDGASKVCAFFNSKFSIRFEDWSYVKLQIAESTIRDIEISIKHHFSNINHMVANLKSSVALLLDTQLVFQAGGNALQIAVSQELSTIISEVQHFLQHISSKMQSLNAELVQWCTVNDKNIIQDPIIIKISERDILDDMLSSLGFKNAQFTNTLGDNYIFTGNCMIDVNSTTSSRSTGKTIINGEPKKTAYDAECSAAANAISFLENVLGIKVVDLSYRGLLEKEDLINRLLCLKAKFDKVEQEVPVEWRSMIGKIKGLVSYKYEVCKQSHLDIDENIRIDCSQIMVDAVADITMFYDLCTVDLDHVSS